MCWIRERLAQGLLYGFMAFLRLFTKEDLMRRGVQVANDCRQVLRGSIIAV